MFSNINNLLITNPITTVEKIMELNKTTINYGLTLTKEEVIDLVNHKNRVLKEIGRIEFDDRFLRELIYEFYDSVYLYQDEYLSILEELTRVFYIYRQELDLKITDEDLIKYMKDKFDTTCYGSIELLEDCLRDLINEI